MRGFLYILQPNRCNAPPISVALYQIVQYMPKNGIPQRGIPFFGFAAGLEEAAPAERLGKKHAGGMFLRPGESP